MKYTYRTKGTCASQIELELEGNVVHNVKFTGGCDGNLKAIPKLVEGMTVEEIENRISGIRCGFKNTSCGDQLAKACRAALEESGVNP
ncbi:MAG: TIGR03905 family TSCPD domain-containing protein [Lachnospiraceae bacterium]|nr:TIGR03905 family TSCPD domain-containing protein [Lachnospiraceae bacterium]